MPLNTRCPQCRTGYLVDSESLMGTSGVAHCYRCGTLFDVLTEKAVGPDDDDILTMQGSIRLDHRAEHRYMQTAGTAAGPDLPDEVEPLQPSPDASLDIADTLYETSSRTGWVYGLIAALLVIGLGLQLAWQYRESLLHRYPELEAVCAHLPCRPDAVRAPDEFRVLQREIQPTEDQPGSLTLKVRFRNQAELPQPLPDIQLSLLDNHGGVLIRRRLTPNEYLLRAPPADARAAPGEVITIAVDFKDPGYLATGFMIDFL